MLPTTVQQILLVVLFVMPGVVYQAVRSRLRGPAPDDRDATFRVLRAIAVSAALDLTYLVVFTDVIVRAATNPQATQSSVRQLAILAFICTIAIPAILAIVSHFLRLWLQRGFRQAAGDFWQYLTEPTAWDWFGKVRSNGYIRVLTKEDTWIGGYAGSHSYISSYPEPRDLYIERAHQLDDNGEFGPPIAEGRASMWIRCDDAKLVHFIADLPVKLRTQPQYNEQEHAGDK